MDSGVVRITGCTNGLHYVLGLERSGKANNQTDYATTLPVELGLNNCKPPVQGLGFRD